MLQEQDKMVYRHEKDCYIFPIQLGELLVVPGETFHQRQQAQQGVSDQDLYDPQYWHGQLGQLEIVIEAERVFWNRPTTR